MLELLKHLWPDFSALATGESLAISVWFWLVMVVIFSVTVVILVINRARFGSRVGALNGLLKDLDKDNMALSRREIRQRAMELKDSDARLLWLEFDDSLVVSGNQKQLFSTLGASYFFNGKTLARGLTGSRLLAAVPSFLVALGVLGTFVGLTVGLSGLVGTSDEVEALKGGINELISGASVAFMTSVWGVLFSLVLNFIEKIFEARVLNKVSKVQQRIDALYQQLPAEQTLLYIAEHSKESKLALQELHERIGDRLQETLSGMSDAMQHAVTDALNTVMAPAIQALVSNSSEQSSQALTALVEQFMSSMASVGREQGGQMQQAAADVNTAVSSIGERLDHLFTNLSEQQNQQLDLAKQQSHQFSSQLQEITHAADQKQEQLEQRFGELMSNLSSQIETQLGVTQSHDEQRQAAFKQQMDESSSSQTALLEQLSQTVSQQVQSMSEVGTERDKYFEQIASNVMATLNTQLAGQMNAAETQDQARNQRFSELMSNLSSQMEKQLGATQSHDEQRQAAFKQQMNESSTSQTALLERLSNTVSEQVQSMTEVGSERDKSFETIVSNVMAKLDAQLANQMDAAEGLEQGRQQRFNEQLEAVAKQQQELLLGMASAVSTTQQQSLEMAQQHQQLLDRLQQSTEAVMTSSKNMDSSANQLGLLSTNVRQASDVLGQRLEAVTEGVENVSAQSTVLAEQLQSQAESLSQLQAALLQGAERFEQAATMARNGFGDMKQTQEEFLSGVKHEFTALGETLRTQVEAIEKQAEEWLQSYAKEVHTQTDDRMNKWNEVSLSYADQMHRNVQAVSGILDELEAR